MARYRRKISAYGYYHIMVRGVNREIIFQDDFDRKRFISTLNQYAEETKVSVIVYCLMTNHVHLLICAPSGPDIFMKKLLSSYVYYYNHKYGRIGHLFQDRFKSEAIESDAYLMTAARYIIQNPQKAGICKADEYEWSNWHDISSRRGFTKTQVLYDLASGQYPLLDYLLSENSDSCLDIETELPMSDADALAAIQKISGENDPTKISALQKEDRDRLLRRIKNSGISVKQIEKITGISRNIIYKIQAI